MNKYKKYLGFAVGLSVYIFLAGASYAADFNALPATGTFGIKKEISVNIKIDTAGETINAAQAKLKFNPAILEVKSLSKDGSVFNFWLQEPKFSNTDGTIEFIGGTTNGISGSSLQVLQVNFVTKGIGSSDISFTDASIAAADGSGTNILSNANGAKFTVSSTAVAPVPVVPTPVQIARKPVEATSLPTTSVVSVSLYPNPGNWYNAVSQFAATWKLTPDISALNSVLNTNPNFTVPAVSEGLFESKTFPAISKDGIYYFHVRFQNSKGWGATTHYRIAVDTQPPVSFKIDVKTGLASDNPSPKIAFNTNDSLSGISRYEVYVNSEEPIITNDLGFMFLPHPPGEYTIKVRAFDKAGNSIEDTVKLEILPIEMPSITSINKKIILGTDDVLIVKGVALQGANVIVTVEDKNKFLVYQSDIKTNPQGEWEVRFDKELRRGDYFISVKAKDSRGALSLPTSPIKISYVDKPVISLFGLDITLRGLIIILVVIGVLVALWFYRKTLLHLARFQRESVIISRDLDNAFDMVKKDLDRIAGIIKKDIPPDEKEVEFNATNKKIVDALDRIEKYMSGDIERLE